MRFDFAVIGGGPAGASAARRLAGAGARVALLERSPMPRYKPCGGALSRQGVRWLDFPVPQSLIDTEVRGARVRLCDRTVESRRPDRLAVLVSRPRFDQFLAAKADEAGARIVWADVRSLDVRPDGVSLVTAAGAEIAAACAIVCDGASGRLSGRVRGRDGPQAESFCLQAEIPVPPGDPYAGLHGVLGIYFDTFRDGYGWVFHHGSYYAVGIGALASSLERPRETFERFVAARGLGLEASRVRGHRVPSGGLPRPTVADRVLLAGDAAGFADPFHGEGMSYAIRSGQLAADAALASADRGDFSASGLSVYADRCREAFGDELAAARTLFRLMNGRTAGAIRRIASHPAVLEKFLGVPAGTLSYRDFLSWLYLRGPWFYVRSRWGSRNSVAAAAD
jgi:geranylgeranyl reductase family protein